MYSLTGKQVVSKVCVVSVTLGFSLSNTLPMIEMYCIDGDLMYNFAKLYI